MAPSKPEKPVLHLETAERFEEWLEANQGHHGVWLKLRKKGGSVPAPSYDEALEAALCFGWIDGQVRRLDDDVYLQSFTPRRPRGSWSKRNVGIVERLEAEGRMRPSGRAEVEAAKADGRWERAYHGPAKAKPPPEFLEALERSPEAKEAYEGLTSAGRYRIYFEIQDAKREETRRRRIERFVEMLERGERPG